MSRITRAPWQRPQPASQHGFIVSAYDDPATVAVAVRCDSWSLLTPDGRYSATGVSA